MGMPEPLRADAALVLTELVTNAVRHAFARADGRINVGWRRAGGDVTIWVRDGGGRTGMPHPRVPGPTEPSGRGLAIVEALAEQWGVRTDDTGTTVWARLVSAPQTAAS